MRSSLVLYREYLRRSEQKIKCLFKNYLDTCGRANSIWIGIRVDVEIFVSGKKKLRPDLKMPRRDQRASVKLIFKITFKFRTSSFLYPTVLPRQNPCTNPEHWYCRQKSYKTIFALPFSMVNQWEAERDERSRSTRGQFKKLLHV